MGGTSTGGASPEACSEACSGLAEGTCLSESDCVSHCDMNAPSWPDGGMAAFAKCAVENPLCFETLEDCMLAQLHPLGTLHTVRVDGVYLNEYDGKVVRVWHDPDAGPPFGGEAAIMAGTFEFEWKAPVHPWTNGPLMLLYIDIDGDQECVPSADVTDSVHAEWNGDLGQPEYHIVVTAPLSDADFVCDYVP